MSKEVKSRPILNDITRGRYREIINLKPQTKRRAVFSLLVLFLAVIASVFLFYTGGTTAQVAEFYPSSCLGNWSDPTLAQDKPDTVFKTDWENFNSTNSALYNGGSKQIFCGGFTGDIPELAEIQKLTLKIHWAKSKKREVISTFPPDEVVEKIVETDTGTTTTTTTDQEQVNEEETNNSQGEVLIEPDNNENQENNEDSNQEELIEEPPAVDETVEPEPVIEEAPPADSEEQSWLYKFINQAKAAITSTPTDEIIDDATNTTSTNEQQIDEGGVENDEEDSSSTTTSTSTATFNEQQIDEGGVENDEEDSSSTTTSTSTATFVDAFPEGDQEYPADALFVIKYSLDGTFWQPLSIITWDEFFSEFDLPILTLNDLANLQISIESLPQAEDNLLVFLDGMVLEVGYQSDETVAEVANPISEEQQAEEILPFKLDEDLITTDKQDYLGQESPEFEIDLNALSTLDIPAQTPKQINTAESTSTEAVIEDEKTTSTSTSTESEAVEPEVVEPEEEPVSRVFKKSLNKIANWLRIRPSLAQTSDIQVISSQVVMSSSQRKVDIEPIVERIGDKLSFRLPKPERSFRPGKYLLKVELSVNGQTVELVKDFTWGVLAINVNKSILRPGELAYLQMAVLDDGGYTICDASLKLTIISPSNKITRLTTAAGDIIYSTSCGNNNITNNPDYYAYYQVEEQGQYQMILENLDKGNSIKDIFEVQANPVFEVERHSATRINPFKATYGMQLNIGFNQDFSGEIREEIPLAFSIERVDNKNEKIIDSRIESDQGRKYIVWQVDMLAGDNLQLRYIYDAPKISPQFYLIGPLELVASPSFIGKLFNKSGETSWQEPRQWQIAADADAFRVTEYYLTTGAFTGTTYDLTLDQDLADNYFVLIKGSKVGDGGSNPDNDYARVYEVPNGKGELPTSGASNVIALSRYVADVDWEGVVTVVESLGSSTSTAGFNLVDIVETSITASSASGSDTSTAWNASSSVVLFGGFNGGGAEFEAASTATGDGNSVQTRLYPSDTGSTIYWTRESTEALFAVTLTTFVVEWGSEWTVQHVNVSGSNIGDGCDATSEYNTGTINSVVRDDTWVWATGIATNNGIGDSFSGTLVTLGDGVNQYTNETSVAFCGEYTSTKNADIYTMTHNDLAVDYRKKADGDKNVLDIPVTVDSATAGYRFGWVTNGCNGSGSAHPRDRFWARYTADTTVTISRGYDGQDIPAWVQGIDFSNISYVPTDSNTSQNHFRWRDDTTALNTDGGWLAYEDNNTSSTWSTITKNDTYRLRVEVANNGGAVETSGRTYELEYGDKTGLAQCSQISTWTGVADSSDQWDMVDSSYISPDGASTTVGLLANTETYSFTQGQGRDSADTTGTIGPMAASTYTELEYSIKATDDTVTGRTYCFRVYDATAGSALDEYDVYPEVTISSVTADALIADYMEWGREFNVSSSTWSTIEFANEYTDPIFLCSVQYANNIGNEPDGDADSAVCRVQNLGSTSTQVLMQEAVRASGYGLEQNETIHWLVVEAGDYDNGDIKMEAYATSSTLTAENGAWGNVQAAGYNQSYTTPVVLGQVTTYNDTGWSVFFAYGSAQANVPDASNLNMGKHVGEDIDVTRSNEDLGVVIIEAAHGTIGGVAYDAQQSSGAPIERIDDFPNYTADFYSPFSTVPEMAIVSQTGISGADGPHQELYSASPFTLSTINPVTMEDEYDGEQGGNPENVGFIAFATSSTLPVAFDQTTYRFYDNINQVQPTTPKAATNTAITSVATNDVVRIRMSVQVGVYDLVTSTQAFKLQWGEKSTTCGNISSWYDLGVAASSTAIWRGYDNSSVASSTQITASLLNNTDNVLESYEEENNSTSTLARIYAGQRGEWDWVVQNNGATASTDYCFRMVTANDDVLQYTNYPQLTTASGGLLSVGIVDTGGSPVTTPSTTMSTLNLGYSCQSSNGTLGVAYEKIRITNTTANPQWSLTISTSTTAFWDGASSDYDFNDDAGAPQGCSDGGGDADSLAGQMNIDPSGGTNTPQGGCSTTGITFGSGDYFGETTTSTITLSTAGGSADTSCYWDLTNIDISQQVPAEQVTDNYSLYMVITVTAI